jgi:large subunit ribosomal protein L9
MKVLMKDTQEIVEVKDSYAANLLIPKGLAVVATQQVIKKKDEKDAAVLAQMQQKSNAEADFAGRVHGKKFVIKSKANSEGELFGSIDKTQVKKVLRTDLKLKIMLAKPIKKLGEHQVHLKIGEHKAVVTIDVEAI